MRGRGPRDLHQAAESERQGTGRHAGHVLEPQAAQQRVDLLVLGDVRMQEAAGERVAPRPGRCLSQAPRQRQVLPDGELVEKLRKLERARQPVAHPGLGSEPGDVLPAEPDRTLLGDDVSGQDPEQSGLARAVGSHQAGYGAFRHPDIHLLQCLEAAEIHRYPGTGKNGGPLVGSTRSLDILQFRGYRRRPARRRGVRLSQGGCRLRSASGPGPRADGRSS